jgi:hypothetical protein
MDYKERVNAIVAKLKCLGLADWTIAVGTERNEAIGINDGYARHDAKYRSGIIDIAPALDDERLTHVVYHEMLHVVLSDFLAPLRLFGHSLEPRQKEYLESIIDYNEERFIESIVPGLIELIEEK